MDLSPLDKYGETIQLVQPRNSEPLHIDDLIEHLFKRMEEVAQPGDYIAFVGDPLLCSAAVMSMISMYGEAKALRWRSQTKHYTEHYFSGDSVPLPVEGSERALG
jgi:hypothetical protein